MAYIYLIFGFVFTFFIPGMFIVNNFYPKLPARIKIALVPILSVLVSTYLVYFVSLIVGFSRYSITISFLLFSPWLVYYFLREYKAGDLKQFIHRNILQLGIGLITFLLFCVALFPGIYTKYGSNIVMSSVNWQDTAMHLGIIESIAEGNFPPQAPYYAGVPLNYYYFTDFHSSILVNLFGNFFPRILVYVNPLYAMCFSFALFALGYEVSKNKMVAGTTSIIGVFFGNLMFVNFIKDVISVSYDSRILINIIELLKNNSYSMEYEQLFQMSSMGDYFLQNRPMMVGLPATTLVFLLLIIGLKKNNLGHVFLAGIITGLLIKFQYFGILIGLISFGIGVVVFFNTKKIGFLLKSIFLFCFPIFLISIPFVSSTNVNDKSLLDMVVENFSLGPWEKGKNLLWFIKFDLANFNAPFFFSTIFAPFFIIFSIVKKKMERQTLFLLLLYVVLFTVPHILRFTVYKGDMFKFFYYMAIPITVLSTTLAVKIIRNNIVLSAYITIVVVSTTSTSFLTLAHSFLNKNVAYTTSEEDAGLWIREQTPKKSIFISMPTVHSPITQIGGRLRLLSYINWPYSHGYNTGDDNVFKRLKDIERVYGESNSDIVNDVLISYNAGYIFYGEEERNNFPDAESFLDTVDFLKVVYNSKGIKIYEVDNET